MVRVPIGNERSARVEVRSVGPDANPYAVLYTVFKTGLDGAIANDPNLRTADRYLPDNIYDALSDFKGSAWISSILGEDVKGRYADLKQGSADRCPRLLGTFVKAGGSPVPTTRSTTSTSGTCFRAGALPGKGQRRRSRGAAAFLVAGHDFVWTARSGGDIALACPTRQRGFLFVPGPHSVRRGHRSGAPGVRNDRSRR